MAHGAQRERSLLLTWAVLMTLSALGAFGAWLADGETLRLAGLGAIALVTLFKARLILADYLELSRAPGWLAGFTVAVFLLLAMVFALIALVPAP